MEEIKIMLLPYADIILTILKYLPILILFIGFVSFFTYMNKNHIIKLLVAKIKGDIAEMDRIRTINIRQTIGLEASAKRNESNSVKALRMELDSYNQKEPGKFEKIKRKIQKHISSTLYYSGLEEKGFSITSAILLLNLIAILIAIIISIFTTGLLGIFTYGSIILGAYYALVIKTRIKRESLEQQLYSFIGAVPQASIKHSGLVDILGDISPSLDAPLGPALRRCYVEAKQTYNEQIALERLKDRFNSDQFSFIIDAFILCSKTMGNYKATAEDISETVKIYVNNITQKQALYKAGRMNVYIITGVCIGLVFALSLFVDGLTNIIFKTAIGNVLLMAFSIIAVYGGTMRVRR